MTWETFTVIAVQWPRWSDLEKLVFMWTQKFWEYRLGGKRVNYDKFKIQTKQCKSNIYPTCILFFLLTGGTWYYHAIYIVFTNLASFTGYEDDIFEVISNLHVQGSKFGENLTNLAENHGVCFFQVCQYISFLFTYRSSNLQMMFPIYHLACFAIPHYPTILSCPLSPSLTLSLLLSKKEITPVHILKHTKKI